MLTLHQATDEIKAVLKWGGILAITVTTVFLIFNGGKLIKTWFDPPKPPPPTVCFGKLPDITFPQNIITEIETYTPDLIREELPTFPDRLEVFEIEQSQPNLLALKKAQEKLVNIGFKGNPIPVSETLFQWEEDIPPNKKIKFDILNQNFELTSDYFNDQEVLAANNLPSEKEAINLSEAFLKNINSFPETIDKSKDNINILSVRNGKLVLASSISLAQVIRVNFYQKDINKLPIYYTNYPASSINLLVGAGGFDGQILEANYSYNKAKTNEKECTYPIKTADQALDELRQGKGYIISYAGINKNVSIKNVFLAYYMENKPSKYLFPIIVFEGNDDFVAYIKAVTGNWLTN